ncbi:hypothetical protein CDCA_CDCA16G4218 [Cyanidium caldarium]|uniref:Peptidase A1 domain-containing protein n=1 Tax=Cyanidium caldarium TaxID=2771 RepID=A0AAV9J1H8_CYACA|nr:hypothetical protein CDCA_CDCA16G4218 [Cyanidium caldarium]
MRSAAVVAWLATLGCLICLFLTVKAEAEGIVVPLVKRPGTLSRVFSYPRRHGELAVRMGRPPSLTRASANNASGELPVNPLGGGLVNVGEYYVNITVDGQTVHVQVDTGSSALAFPLAPCVRCLQGDRRVNLVRYNESAVPCSDTSVCKRSSCTPLCGACSPNSRACCSPVETDACGFLLVYGDGSFALGALHTGRVTMNATGITVDPAYFGGILLDSPSFEHPDVDGIWGMAYPALACNPSCVTPLFDSMVQTGAVPRNMFSLCMTETGGAMVLGGEAGPEIRAGEYAWVPMMDKSRPMYYQVGLESLSVGDNGTSLLPGIRSAIVDSGTTLLVVSESSFRKLREHFQRHYCRQVPGLCGSRTWFDPQQCATLSDSQVARLPTINFALAGGVQLSLPPDVYMIKAASHGRVYRCLGMQYLSGGLVASSIILGDTFMRRYVTVFDRAKSRIGFAESRPDCGLNTLPVSTVASSAAAPPSLLSSIGGVSATVWSAFRRHAIIWLATLLAVAAVAVLTVVVCRKRAGRNGAAHQRDGLLGTSDARSSPSGRNVAEERLLANA